MPFLSALPQWEPSDRPLLVISPHPDDETIGTGGLITCQIIKGIPVTVVAVTDGEVAYGNCPGLGALRQTEQERALKLLGVATRDIIRFRMPDSCVEQHESVLIDRLLGLVSQDTHIIAPWKGDFHPDHQACGRAAETVANLSGARLTSYFFWTWHRGTPALLHELNLQRLQLQKRERNTKWNALQEHESQLHWAGEQPILPDALLGPMRRPFEVFAI